MRLELRGRQRCAARQRTSLSAGEDIGSRALSGVLAAAWRLGVEGRRSLTRHERPFRMECQPFSPQPCVSHSPKVPDNQHYGCCQSYGLLLLRY